MAETWTCPHHGHELPADGPAPWCPDCMADMTNAPDPSTMTPDARVAEIDHWQYLVVPFPLIHARIEALVGRSVWTHEMGTVGIEHLKAEARERTGRMPDAETFLAGLPPERTILVREAGR